MLDLEELRFKIRVMRRHQALYRLLKEELGKLGYWKNRPRGNPKAGYQKGFGKL